jgi:hypothetical protein
MNSSAWKTPMLSAPRIAMRHHHAPVGRCLAWAVSRIPIGSVRTTAVSNGRSAGISSVVTRYVVPHAAGASAVSRTVRTMG